MSAYIHLTSGERDRIAKFRSEGLDPTAIGRVIGRCKSTISRELRRNAREGVGYRATYADGSYHHPHQTRHRAPTGIYRRRSDMARRHPTVLHRRKMRTRNHQTHHRSRAAVTIGRLRYTAHRGVFIHYHYGSGITGRQNGIGNLPTLR